MKKILVSALVALTLAGCSTAEPVAVPEPTPSAVAKPVVTAEPKAPVSFARESVEAIPAPVVTAEPIAEPVELPAEPVAPIAEPIAPVVPAEPVEQPVRPVEPTAVPVQPVAPAEPVETITETREPMPGHWGHSALASRGLYANIVVVDVRAVCQIPSGTGGCVFVGDDTIMMSADLGPDWRGMHVLFHEYAHAVLGIVNECEAEAYAHSMTGVIVWSYEECKP